MRLPMIDGGCFRGVGGGMPVVAAPAEMDIATVGELRAVLLAAAVAGHAVIVVDMTGTRMCDSSGLRVLAEAHRRAMAAGGELRLVLPAAGGPRPGLDRREPLYTQLRQSGRRPD